MQSVHVYNLNKIMTPIVIKKGKLFQNLLRLNIMFTFSMITVSITALKPTVPLFWVHL